MKMRLATPLGLAAEQAFEDELRIAQLHETSMPLMGYGIIAPEPLPVLWIEGETVTLRPRLFGLIGLASHRVRVVGIDRCGLAIRTDERGGPILRWDHRMRIESLGPGHCRQIEEIEAESILPPASPKSPAGKATANKTKAKKEKSREKKTKRRRPRKPKIRTGKPRRRRRQSPQQKKSRAKR